MKRVQWTIGMALFGYLLIAKEDIYFNLGRTTIAVCWAAVMGLGIGALVDKKNPTQRFQFYWSLTLAPVFALIGLLIAPYSYGWTLPQAYYSVGGAIVGALLGTIIGSIHRQRLIRASTQP